MDRSLLTVSAINSSAPLPLEGLFTEEAMLLRLDCFSTLTFMGQLPLCLWQVRPSGSSCLWALSNSPLCLALQGAQRKVTPVEEHSGEAPPWLSLAWLA